MPDNKRFASLLTALGALLLVIGVGLFSWPAALVLAGLLLIAAGLFAIDVGDE